MKRPLTELLAIDPDSIVETEESGLTNGTESGPFGSVSNDTVDEKDESLCIECGDQPTELVCKDCDEWFCAVCFVYLHRTGVSFVYLLVDFFLVNLTLYRNVKATKPLKLKTSPRLVRP